MRAAVTCAQCGARHWRVETAYHAINDSGGRLFRRWCVPCGGPGTDIAQFDAACKHWRTYKPAAGEVAAPPMTDRDRVFIVKQRAVGMAAGEIAQLLNRPLSQVISTDAEVSAAWRRAIVGSA